MSEMTERELAWAAGLFEGEGSIRVAKETSRTRGTLVAAISNTDEQVVQFFASRWQGTLKPATGQKPTQRPAWVWVVYALKAARFLEDILPYVVTDRVRVKAELGLEFQRQKEFGRTDEEYRRRQVDFYWRMRVLNHRGTGPVPCRPDDWAAVGSGRAHRRGAANPQAKLTQAQADEIRNRRASGEAVKALAAEFGVSTSLISLVGCGRAYVTGAGS